MGFSYAKRISLLKQQTDDQLEGRISLPRAFFLVFLGFVLFFYFLSFIFSSASSEIDEIVSDEQSVVIDTWRKGVRADYEERIRWLESSPIALMPFGSKIYDAYSRTVVGMFSHESTEVEPGDIVDLGAWWEYATQSITNILLRLGFVVVAFAPLWAIAFVVGYYGFKKRFRLIPTTDLLGVCDRKKGPFYSGIYGPLRPNGSFSATDLSCPNLACPELVESEKALEHPLIQILKTHRAFNQTNLDLVRVILQYADFPSVIEVESSTTMDEEDENSNPLDVSQQVAQQTGFLTNAGGTILQSAMEGLSAALEAHQALSQYVKSLQQKNVNNSALNANYLGHVQQIKPLLEKLSPSAKVLMQTLTPNRVWAMGFIPPAIIASAYLALEAGKCLVFKRQDSGFVRISHFPHLQARSVIQSLVSYHKEYNGDVRLIIRQAIICSRRHGDFGRAFLPDRMPVESRALRDWLEILYSSPKRRETAAHLVELDAHIEEISVNWRHGYMRRVKQLNEAIAKSSDLNADLSRSACLSKGLVYKSVVLIPLQEVLNVALRGIDEARVKRISQLLSLTKNYQTNLSISARLPGFKRQALDAQKAGNESAELLALIEGGPKTIEHWTIIRRMLTRYNWLSTRVGDFAVPMEGLVHGLLYETSANGLPTDLFGLNTLVPIRQRRHDEIFGKQWESIYFNDSPHPENIRVFVDPVEFKNTFSSEKIRVDKERSAGSKSSPTAASA